MAIRNEALEHFREVLRHLLECELKRLVFAVFKRDHELFDLVIAAIQLFLSLKKLRLFLGERDELIQGFFVDVAKKIVKNINTADKNLR